MPLEIIVGNIADQKTDIIVSSSNNKLLATSDNSLAILEKIGKHRIEKELKNYQKLEITEMAVTSGFNLCKYIIHVVGPIYDENINNKSLLTDAYNNVLNKAIELEAESISFPIISAGANNFPGPLALDVAVKTIGNFVEKHDLDVKLVLLPEEKSKKIKYPELHRLIKRSKLEAFLHKPKIVRLEQMTGKQLPEDAEVEKKTGYEYSYYAPCSADGYDLDDILDNMDISFSKTVLNLIDEKGYKDSEVYKRANLDRRLFSKLRSSDNYQPSKSTAIALAFALRLSVPQTDDLLLKAGYSLSKSNVTDMIVEYCLNNEIYNIYEVNELLFRYDQKQLGSI
ncbi:MAG: macro domain-containing protein [Erysipelotrichaceae bacterium]|jgi:O-acetyl-ADP-ribose deacetylase (regulator of RNase III)|nr:hypothetical protein [Erysipelotrichia bacterium]